MEPNELDLLPTDELVRLVLEARDPHAWYALPPKDLGPLTYQEAKAKGVQMATFMMLTFELARRTSALQAQIDGMIKRPVVEVVKSLCHELQVNGRMIYVSSYNEELLHNMKSDLTRALGMDDPKEGGSDA